MKVLMMSYSKILKLNVLTIFFMQGQLFTSTQSEDLSLKTTILQANFYCKNFQNKHKQPSFIDCDNHRNNLLQAVRESNLSDDAKIAIQDQAFQDDCCVLLTTPLTCLAAIFTLGHTPMNAQSHIFCCRTVLHVQEIIKEKND